MANAYKVTCQSIVNDGTNIYVIYQIYTGSQTLPPIQATFPVTGTTYAVILNYLQTVANNQPTMPSDLPPLVGLTIAGV